MNDSAVASSLTAAQAVKGTAGYSWTDRGHLTAAQAVKGTQA